MNSSWTTIVLVLVSALLTNLVCIVHQTFVIVKIRRFCFYASLNLPYTYPWFMTDQAGYQGLQYRFREEPALKNTSTFFLNTVDELIPIEINRPGFEKIIFWFSQTPELMNILESAARTSKLTEIGEDRATDKTTATIQLEIFATITRGDVHVIVDVIKKQKLEISLLNSSGEILQIPVDNLVLEKGDHPFSMDLSPFSNGLYFIRIKSDPGVTTIHRLFKQ